MKVETYTSWLVLPVAGCLVTAEGCVYRRPKYGPAPQFQWRNAR